MCIGSSRQSLEPRHALDVHLHTCLDLDWPMLLLRGTGFESEPPTLPIVAALGADHADTMCSLDRGSLS